jgi:hypothetical protein
LLAAVLNENVGKFGKEGPSLVAADEPPDRLEFR